MMNNISLTKNIVNNLVLTIIQIIHRAMVFIKIIIVIKEDIYVKKYIPLIMLCFKFVLFNKQKRKIFSIIIFKIKIIN